MYIRHPRIPAEQSLSVADLMSLDRLNVSFMRREYVIMAIIIVFFFKSAEPLFPQNLKV